MLERSLKHSTNASGRHISRGFSHRQVLEEERGTRSSNFYAVARTAPRAAPALFTANSERSEGRDYA